MTLTRRQLDFRMKLAKEFASTPEVGKSHKSPSSISTKGSKKKKFLENPRKSKQPGEVPL